MGAWQVLSSLVALQNLAVYLKLSPTVLLPNIGHKRTMSLLLLNSIVLAVACSTYYSFCGNGAVSMKVSGAAWFDKTDDKAIRRTRGIVWLGCKTAAP